MQQLIGIAANFSCNGKVGHLLDEYHWGCKFDKITEVDFRSLINLDLPYETEIYVHESEKGTLIIGTDNVRPKMDNTSIHYGFVLSDLHQTYVLRKFEGSKNVGFIQADESGITTNQLAKNIWNEEIDDVRTLIIDEIEKLLDLNLITADFTLTKYQLIPVSPPIQKKKKVEPPLDQKPKSKKQPWWKFW